jgi:hypothetical protein
VALIIVVGCGLLTLWLGGRAAGLLGPAAVERTATARLPTARPTPLPALEATATPEPLPSATQVPATDTAPPPAGPQLLLVKADGDNALVVINRGQGPLSLAPLTLGEGRGAIDGDEWELAALESGACVAAWREDRRQELPKGVDCELEGEHVERAGQDRFWRDTFAVFYEGVELATCEKREALCTVSEAP